MVFESDFHWVKPEGFTGFTKKIKSPIRLQSFPPSPSTPGLDEYPILWVLLGVIILSVGAAAFHLGATRNDR